MYLLRGKLTTLAFILIFRYCARLGLRHDKDFFSEKVMNTLGKRAVGLMYRYIPGRCNIIFLCLNDLKALKIKSLQQEKTFSTDLRKRDAGNLLGSYRALW